VKILITGAGGFVGRRMVEYFSGQGHDVIGVDRNKPFETEAPSTFRYIQADTMLQGDWQEEAGISDVVINLAGKNIFGRWTEKTKQEIYESRIKTTENVVAAFSPGANALLLSTSAVGIYGSRGDDLLDENQPSGGDFLATLCVDWEAAANKGVEKGLRVANMRFSLVMGKNGGALKTMLPAFKGFVGGPLASGKQFMPWIHIDDLVSAHDFVVSNPEMSGPVNCCAPQAVRNEDFTKTLASVLNRPAVFRVPKFALGLVMGELGEMILSSQRAEPAKLLAHGFTFAYPQLRAALEDLLT
jgi:uncharacterized protein